MQFDVHRLDLVPAAPHAGHQSHGALALGVCPSCGEPHDLLAAQGAIDVPVPAVELQVVVHLIQWHLVGVKAR